MKIENVKVGAYIKSKRFGTPYLIVAICQQAVIMRKIIEWYNHQPEPVLAKGYNGITRRTTKNMYKRQRYYKLVDKETGEMVADYSVVNKAHLIEMMKAGKIPYSLDKYDIMPFTRNDQYEAEQRMREREYIRGEIANMCGKTIPAILKNERL